MGFACIVLHILCEGLIGSALRFALAVDTFERRAVRGLQRLRGSLRRLYDRFLVERGRPVRGFPRRHPWNRTPRHVEEQVVRLHVEQPQLGAGQLMRTAERVLGFRAARETIRQILIRRRELVVEQQALRRRQPQRIRVSRPGQLWGVDLTLLWVLGFWPVWVLGVVDYCGSRLVVLERVRWPTSAEVIRALEGAIGAHGAPARLLSDRGAVFTSGEFEAMCIMRGVRHVLTRPAHPWTNGRIERVFRTFKEEVVRRYVWLFANVGQIDRYCEDFRLWHNRDRPHSAYGGRTPDEVFFGRPKELRALERVSYFEGNLRWYRFGPAG
jgi:transposase InsO family protein